MWAKSVRDSPCSFLSRDFCERLGLTIKSDEIIELDHDDVVKVRFRGAYVIATVVSFKGGIIVKDHVFRVRDQAFTAHFPPMLDMPEHVDVGFGADLATVFFDEDSYDEHDLGGWHMQEEPMTHGDVVKLFKYMGPGEGKLAKS